VSLCELFVGSAKNLKGGLEVMKTKLFIIGVIVGCIIMTGTLFVHAQEPSEEKLNINVAPLEELQKLPGITPEIAQAIITQRPYQQIEGLLKIEGVDEKVLAQFQDKIEAAKLNINSATVKELMVLPEIDQELAEKIINNRTYEVVDELLKISGFSEERLDKIKDLIEAVPVEENGKGKKGGWKTRKKIFLIRESGSSSESNEKDEDSE
jgi:competence protein ComEA